MRRLYSYCLALIFATITACEETEFHYRGYPRLHTLAPTNVTTQSATFNAEIDSRGNLEILEHGFVWSAGGSPTLFNGAESIIVLGSPSGNRFSMGVSSTFESWGSGIYAPKKYVRAFVRTSDYTVYGDAVAAVVTN